MVLVTAWTIWLDSFCLAGSNVWNLFETNLPWLDVISGVQEGSVCCPLLYNIYVNDKPDCLQFCKIIMYADDARVFINYQCDNAYEKMLDDLERITQWSTVWQLKLNVKKCGVLHLGYRNKSFDCFLSNEKLQTSNDMNDLGITVDKTLHFNAYIDSIIARAYRMCSTILSGFYTKYASFLITTYKAYVRPILEYNTVIWSPSCLTCINKCERVQRFFLPKGCQDCGILHTCIDWIFSIWSP